jgi:hypothetical protein
VSATQSPPRALTQCPYPPNGRRFASFWRMAKGRLLPHRSSASKRMSTDEEDVGLLLLLRGRRHARRHYRGDRLVVAYTPRAREDVRPSRLSREVLRALWSPTLHAQRAGTVVSTCTCHANARCSSLGRSHQCARGTLPYGSKLQPHNATGNRARASMSR